MRDEVSDLCHMGLQNVARQARLRSSGASARSGLNLRVASQAFFPPRGIANGAERAAKSERSEVS
jgi:hypothetical protein